MVSWIRLAVLAFGHLVVDAYALFVPVVMVYCVGRFGLTKAAAGALMTAVAISTSLSQPVWGLLSDRFLRTWLLVLGPWVAMVFSCGLGWTDTYAGTVVMLTVAGMGVAAFHPEAAAVASRVSGSHATFGAGVFMFGGALGLAVGPPVAAALIGWDGTHRLYLAAVPGLVLVPALMAVARTTGPGPGRRARTAARAGSILGPSPRTLLLLLGLSSFRAFAINGMVAGIGFIFRARGYTLGWVGMWLSLFMISGAVAGLVLGWTARRRTEKPMLVATFALSVPAVLLFPYVRGPWVPVVLVLCGALTSATVPLVLAMAQRLMPGDKSLASSLMLGMAWGLGGAAPPLVGMLADTAGGAEQAMPMLAAALGLALICSLVLPTMVTHATVGPVPSGEETT